MTWGMCGSQVHDEGLTSYAHRGNEPGERASAVRAVAAMSEGAADCAYLLDVLGLDPSEGTKETR
jgi:hypothetical protein